MPSRPDMDRHSGVSPRSIPSARRAGIIYCIRRRSIRSGKIRLDSFDGSAPFIVRFPACGQAFHPLLSCPAPPWSCHHTMLPIVGDGDGRGAASV